jgi:hypothetical protein
MDMNSVMLSSVRPASILNWKFQGQAQSLGYRIRSGDIEKVHVSIIFDKRYVYLVAVGVEVAERMEITVGNCRDPLLWF